MKNYKGWAFAWAGNRRHHFICNIVAITRIQCIRKAEEESCATWKELYRAGGRCIKIIIQPR